MSAAPCPCGHRRDPDFDRFVGVQALGDGSVAALHNCKCGTTYTSSVVTDAALCVGCGLIVGGADGPKIVECPADGEGVIRCEPCARAALGPTAFHVPPKRLRDQLPRHARMYG